MRRRLPEQRTRGPGCGLIETHRECVRIGLLVHLAVKLVIPADFHLYFPYEAAQLKVGWIIWRVGRSRLSCPPRM